jgi:chromatin segregation and condensation protein Rec8/ScpA/Scc1 (kleisin family)
MTLNTIRKHLTESEITEIDMRAIANLILNITIDLSQRATNEIIGPISRWLDDPAEFLEKHKVIIDKTTTKSSASYKSTQRLWTKIERHLQAEKMILYHAEIRRRKSLRKEISQMLGKNRPRSDPESITIPETSLEPILAPFSPPEQEKAQTRTEFDRSRNTSPSNLLPWQAMISAEVQEPTPMSGLTEYYPENPKQDTVSKLTHLLHMQMDGQINLHQAEPFAEITIEPLDIDPHLPITIKDRESREYQFDWHQLNDDQKAKVVADLKDNRILCRT